MKYSPSLIFEKKSYTTEERKLINDTIHYLGLCEEMFRENNFEYEHDVFHESRCILIKIRDFGRLDKNEDYIVTKKDNLNFKDDN